MKRNIITMLLIATLILSNVMCASETTEPTAAPSATTSSGASTDICNLGTSSTGSCKVN
jgi:hypothetical protein